MDSLQSHNLNVLLDRWITSDYGEHKMTQWIDQGWAREWSLNGTDWKYDNSGGFVAIFNPVGFQGSPVYGDKFDYSFNMTPVIGYSQYQPSPPVTELYTKEWVVPSNTYAYAFGDLEIVHPYTYWRDSRMWNLSTANDTTLSFERDVYIRVSTSSPNDLGELKIYRVTSSGAKIRVFWEDVDDLIGGTAYHNVYVGKVTVPNYYYNKIDESLCDNIDISFHSYSIPGGYKIKGVYLMDTFTSNYHLQNVYSPGTFHNLLSSFDDDILTYDTGDQTVYGFYINEMNPGSFYAAKLWNQEYNGDFGAFSNPKSWYGSIGINSSFSYSYRYTPFYNMFSDMNSIPGISGGDIIGNNPIAVWQHLYLITKFHKNVRVQSIVFLILEQFPVG